ncbi:hypothetical protein PENTCL1PPCAC_25222, partial [Pristionchus entomophagus]
SSYRYIIQSQIFANLGAVSLLAFADVFNWRFSDTVIFHLEILSVLHYQWSSWSIQIDSIFHFAICSQSFSEKKWTDGVPAVTVTTALIAIVKTYAVKLSNVSDDGYKQARDQRSMFTTILIFGCPLIEKLCEILFLNS